MARMRTAYGRLIQEAGLDSLEEMLEHEERVEAWRAVAANRPQAGPLGTVLDFGVGRFAWVPYMLARMGVSLVLFDRDILERRNLAAGNSVFREKDIGKPKALAMKELLQEHAPGIHVEAHQADIMMLDESELRALGNGASVVLGLVDGGPPLLAINRAFHSVAPVVYAAGHREARTGDVMITRPQTACLQCLLDIDSPDDIRTLAGEITHGIDIVSISQVCVRVVLELLGDTRLSEAGELLGPSNFIFIENRRSPTSPRGFASRFLRIERRRTCPICGAF